ncbi:MAG: PaaI family thioesterase [Planctomycetales bacterium]|nr:PaaI family thioesterase [Planctomycetales bacterium]
MNLQSDDSFAWAPIGNLLGLEILPERECEMGVAEVRLQVGERFHNPMGFVHGGVISLIADAAMGIAFGRTLDDQHGFVTVEMKTCFIRPIRRGYLSSRARLIDRGLRLGFLECTVQDGRQKLIATASCTCSITSL